MRNRLLAIGRNAHSAGWRSIIFIILKPGHCGPLASPHDKRQPLELDMHALKNTSMIKITGWHPDWVQIR